MTASVVPLRPTIATAKGGAREPLTRNEVHVSGAQRLAVGVGHKTTILRATPDTLAW